MELKYQISNFLDREFKYIDTLNIVDLESDGFLEGKLGVAYFYYILYQNFEEEYFFEKTDYIVSNIFDNLNSSNLLSNCNYKDGVIGLCFFVRKLAENNLIDIISINDILSFLEEKAFSFCKFLIENMNNYDFLNGSIGILYYFDKYNNEDYVKIILELLHQRIQYNFYNKSHYIEGTHFGYSHGIFALVKILENNNSLYSVDIKNQIFNIIDDILLKGPQKLNNKYYYFPRLINNDIGMNWQPVLSWSNSDINFCNLILSSKDQNLKNKYFDIAINIGKNCCKKKNEEETRIWDHNLFYGSSGVAQSFKKIYIETGEIEFKSAYNFWINETLNYLNNPYINKHNSKEPDLAFLSGRLGSNIVLLNYISNKIDNWDEIILL